MMLLLLDFSQFQLQIINLQQYVSKFLLVQLPYKLKIQEPYACIFQTGLLGLSETSQAVLLTF